MASIINRTIQAIPQTILDRITPAGKQLDGLMEIHHDSMYDHDATFPLTVDYGNIYWLGTIDEHVVFKAILAEIVEPTPEPSTPEPPEPRITVDLQFIAGEYIWATTAMLGDHITPNPLLISELGLQHSIHGWGAIENYNGVEIVTPALQIPIAITESVYYDKVSMEPLARFIALGRDGDPMPIPTEPPVPTEEPTIPPTEDQWGFPIIDGRENVIINVQYDLLQHGYAQLHETILNEVYLQEYEPQSLTMPYVGHDYQEDHIHFKVTYEGKHGNDIIGKVDSHYEYPLTFAEGTPSPNGYTNFISRDAVLNESGWDPTTFDTDDTDGRYVSFEGILWPTNTNDSPTYEPFNIYEVNGKKWRVEQVTGIRHYWDPVAQEYAEKKDKFTLYFSVDISYDETDVNVDPNLPSHYIGADQDYVTLAPYGAPDVNIYLTKHVSLDAISSDTADRNLTASVTYASTQTTEDMWEFDDNTWGGKVATIMATYNYTTVDIVGHDYVMPGAIGGGPRVDGAVNMTFNLVDTDGPFGYVPNGPYSANRWWPTTKHIITYAGRQYVWATYQMTNLATGLVEDVVVATHIVINFPNESTNGIIDILPNGLNDIVNNTNGVVEIPQLGGGSSTEQPSEEPVIPFNRLYATTRYYFSTDAGDTQYPGTYLGVELELTDELIYSEFDTDAEFVLSLPDTQHDDDPRSYMLWTIRCPVGDTMPYGATHASLDIFNDNILLFEEQVAYNNTNEYIRDVEHTQFSNGSLVTTLRVRRSLMLQGISNIQFRYVFRDQAYSEIDHSNAMDVVLIPPPYCNLGDFDGRKIVFLETVNDVDESDVVIPKYMFATEDNDGSTGNPPPPRRVEYIKQWDDLHRKCAFVFYIWLNENEVASHPNSPIVDIRFNTLYALTGDNVDRNTVSVEDIGLSFNSSGVLYRGYKATLHLLSEYIARPVQECAINFHVVYEPYGLNVSSETFSWTNVP